MKLLCWWQVQKLVACLLITTVCHNHCVEGDYVLNIRTYSYTNPNNHCATCISNANGEYGCCDAHNNTQQMCTGAANCDTYFYYCLNQLWSRETSCSGGQFSHIDVDSFTQVNFSRDGVQGLRNPLIFNGTNKWMGTTLFILVGDADGDLAAAIDDDIVDIFHININSSVGSVAGQQQYNGLYNIAQIELSYEVSCAINFTGQFCENLDTCSLENVSCSGNGQCVNGPDSFSCICDPGFTGELCQESVDTCVGVDCSGKGQCEESRSDTDSTIFCICDPGYTGRFCENSIEFDSNVDSHDLQTDNRTSSAMGAIIGGVIGAIVTLIFLVLLVVIGFTVLIKKLKWSTTFRSTPFGNHNGRPTAAAAAASYIPGDNPIYGADEESLGAIRISFQQGMNARLPWAGMRQSQTSSLSSNTSETGTQHELQNPLYGSVECDNEYAIPGGPVYATVDSIGTCRNVKDSNHI